MLSKNVPGYKDYFNGGRNPNQFPINKLELIINESDWCYDKSGSNRLLFKHRVLGGYYLEIPKNEKPVFKRYYVNDKRITSKNHSISGLLLKLINYEPKEYHLIFNENSVKVVSGKRVIDSLGPGLFPKSVEAFKVLYHHFHIIFKDDNFLRLLEDSESFIYY
ncbi:hypothetical protein GF352_04920 [archaeon]|nr:hypothetical protein [archaeon]